LILSQHNTFKIQIWTEFLITLLGFYDAFAVIK